MRELTLEEIDAVSGGFCGYGWEYDNGYWSFPWLTASTIDHSAGFGGGGGGGGGGFWAGLGSFFHAAGDFLGFDGQFGPGGSGSLSFGNLGSAFTSGIAAVGDFLGFDGRFGYQGQPELAGPNAFFAPPLLGIALEPLTNLLDATMPPVHLHPFEVSLQEMHSQAAQTGRQLAGQLNEHVSVGYYDVNGDLQVSRLITQNSPTGVVWSPTALPAGSTIVYVQHNHGIAEAFPSSQFNTPAQPLDNDWASLRRLIGTDYSPWGVNVSPFVVQYITDIQGNTYAYYLDTEPQSAKDPDVLGELVR